MKYKFYCVIFIGLIVIFGLALSKFSGCPKENQPDIVIDSLINLGIIGYEEITPQWSIAFQNMEEDTISIEYIDASCGCINSVFSLHPISPHDTSTISFTFKPTSSGYVERHIFIYFKQFVVPVHILLKAFVVKP
ncbi:MAG: DUF1573 domain-containing protein [Bacteroidales bacterium]|jgi:hypothetical protein|nr:DUF1573 domain-containing protein [Bacteroidales bacterium]